MTTPDPKICVTAKCRALGKHVHYCPFAPEGEWEKAHDTKET